MRTDRFFKRDDLPFAELRYSQSSKVSFKPHMHRALSLGVVEKGKVLYTINNEKEILAPGAVVIMNPEALHTCNPVDDTARSYYMLHLDTEWCGRVQASVWEVESFVMPQQSRVDDTSLYEQYLAAVASLMDDQVHLQEKELMLFDLVSEVSTRVCKPGKDVKVNTANVDELKSLLSKDLDRDFTIDSLAWEMGINPYTMIRSFKALTGITPHAYRMNCRINKARDLLRQGWDIARTALECGFFDQSHFHRHFKAMTTVTPQEYRINFVQ